MTKTEIIKRIENAGLAGRGGASFPVSWKWKSVAESLKSEKEGYIILNAAEGEPGVKKDQYILDNYLNEVLNGILLADSYLTSNKIKKIFLYLNKDYLKQFKKRINKELEKKAFKSIKDKIEYFVKPSYPGYISGEESAILNIIEGKKIRPRLKPPYPSCKGLYSKPTLMQNVETFYDISLVSRNEYNGQRFYYINGNVKKPGVYRFFSDLPIEEVLKRSGNYTDESFFVQVGGQASGEVLNSDQLFVPAESTASIMVYNKKRTDEKKLIKFWLRFYQKESCGNCSICREGTYRLYEMIKKDEYDKKLFFEIVSSLKETSFCALGASLPVPIYSYFKNVLKEKIVE
ncbi:MAG: hypothetical protein PF488_01850 [Patescibacteria group bacterium]|jgi:NADH:ubiquinone oxidoreductase subunit F (NADH-binding)|nr:hypothetical protein [Patescibacteria group bacterium]